MHSFNYCTGYSCNLQYNWYIEVAHLSIIFFYYVFVGTVTRIAWCENVAAQLDLSLIGFHPFTGHEGPSSE